VLLFFVGKIAYENARSQKESGRKTERPFIGPPNRGCTMRGNIRILALRLLPLPLRGLWQFVVQNGSVLEKGLLGLGVLSLIFVVLWIVPEWQVEHLEKAREEDVPRLINEYRWTLAQIIGGLGLLFGLYLTWRRITATEESVRVAQEGQITEHFTRAIDQLGEEGKEKLPVRLGGIYALERIAKDSEKDHWAIMEVLTAYIRENVPRKEEPPSKEDNPSDKKQPAEKNQPPPRLVTDIQAILTVLGRRERTHEKLGQRLDLHGTDLHGADLSGAHLFEADLSGADLSRANLSGAILSGAILSGANLFEADLSRAILSGANLRGTDLSGANLNGAHLIEATLSGANLFVATLRGAVLRGAKNLTREQIESAIINEETQLPDYLQAETVTGGAKAKEKGSKAEAGGKE